MSIRIGYIFIIAYFMVRFLKRYTTGDLLVLGVMWTGLWLTFEWGGSLMVGRSVTEILIGWNIFKGYMWPYVLATYLSSCLLTGIPIHPNKPGSANIKAE
jgi:hypothetical protein